MAISLAPAENGFMPVVVRGRVVEWLDGDGGWEVVDELVIKYTGQAHPARRKRVVGLVAPETQRVGIG